MIHFTQWLPHLTPVSLLAHRSKSNTAEEEMEQGWGKKRQTVKDEVRGKSAVNEKWRESEREECEPLEINVLQSKPKQPKKQFDVNADRDEHDLYSVLLHITIIKTHCMTALIMFVFVLCCFSFNSI